MQRSKQVLFHGQKPLSFVIADAESNREVLLHDVEVVTAERAALGGLRGRAAGLTHRSSGRTNLRAAGGGIDLAPVLTVLELMLLVAPES